MDSNDNETAGPKLRRPLPADRTYEQVRHHYEVEKTLVTKLKQASREQRAEIYRTIHDELFRQVPDHPRLTRRDDEQRTVAAIQEKLSWVGRFIDTSHAIVEFAPGDCRLAMELCNRAKSVFGVDISDQRGRVTEVPDNFKLVVYDGYHLDMEEESVDVVFSDQLIEHLHPEDAQLHFETARRILKKGGKYVFRCPHRYSGPHDVSGYFSLEAEGFHLNEPTFAEMATLLKKVGFASWHGYWYKRRIGFWMPFFYFQSMEMILNVLPQKLKRLLGKCFLPVIFIAAVK